MKTTAKFIVLHPSVHKTGGVATVPAHRAWIAAIVIFFIITFAFTLITTRDAAARATASAAGANSQLSKPISDALLHYASANSTPSGRMSAAEMKVVASVLRRCAAPCNLLAFGLTHETLLWNSLNHDGRTVFVDESSYFVSKFEEKHPSVEVYDVQFTTKVRELYDLIEHYKREHLQGLSHSQQSSSMALAPAPKALSLSSLSPPHPFQNPNPTLTFPKLNYYRPPSLIICKSTETDIADCPGTIPGLDGSGPSAPTRGDIFLQRHQSSAASATVLAEIQIKQKKNKNKTVKASALTVPSCYGCGAPLQTSESDAPGYVEPELYSLKKKHRQLRTVLCGRCRLLSHGHMITAVGGNGGYSGGKQFVTAEELREKLSYLRHEKALIVKLVDIVDFSGCFLARIRDLAGANPIILVITKVDLLPKGTDLNCVGDWVVEATMKKKLNVLSVHLTSSKSLVGISGVASEIQKEKKGRDVYILGSANVGKSAFINALLKLLSYKDPVAAAAKKYKPIQSAVPGTTLGPIQIEAFQGGGRLYDTPGVHLHHRLAAVIHSEDLPALAPRSRLRGQPFPNPYVMENSLMGRIRSSGLIGFSIFWGGLVRIDIMKVLPETRLMFYGPKALQLHVVPTKNADEFYQKEVGVLLTPPTGKQKADSWMGLEAKHELQIKYHDIDRPTCDVAISGLGWICVEPFSQSCRSSRSSGVEAGGEIALVVHVPKPVGIFIRPPIPVGSAGGEWYQYRELTEREQEVRPKWYF